MKAREIIQVMERRLETGPAERKSHAVQTRGEGWFRRGCFSWQQRPLEVRRPQYSEAGGVEMTKDYLVVFAKCAGTNFSGHAPDVPGCVSTGDTLEEMRSMMREALEFHFQGLTAEGEAIPEPTTQNVEFKPEDFENVEYFVVLKLAVDAHADSEQLNTHQAA